MGIKERHETAVIELRSDKMKTVVVRENFRFISLSIGIRSK